VVSIDRRRLLVSGMATGGCLVTKPAWAQGVASRVDRAPAIEERYYDWDATPNHGYDPTAAERAGLATSMSQSFRLGQTTE
jgi:hypothetical protein